MTTHPAVLLGDGEFSVLLMAPSFDRFGQAVAIDGDTIVVGVPDDTLGQVERQGDRIRLCA